MNAAYRDSVPSAQLKEHKQEVVAMQNRHDNEHRQSLIKIGAPLGTPPHHSETKRMRVEGREL